MTTKFARKFTIEKLQQNPIWWKELLIRLKPSGETLGETGLRLAVRDGYVNFYHQGQAIAKVGITQDGLLRSEQHIKYVFESATSQKYTKLIGDDKCIINPENNKDVAQYLGSETLDLWIARSKKHKGEEKTFVEQVVAANENIIDMEMGLPGSGYRIDLVTIEEELGQAKVVLWEAKLTSDTRCRSSKDQPEVIKQINKYREFLTKEKNQSEVINAYIAACKVQMHICQLAGKQVSKTIEAVAKGTLQLVLDTEPRLLFLHNPKNPQKDSWQTHLQKLIDNQIRLQVMTTDSERILLSATELDNFKPEQPVDCNHVQTSVTIMRGADTIGGSCIKINHGDDAIVLDYGSPIMDNTGTPLDPEFIAEPSVNNGVLLDIQQQDRNPPLAYILSHAHPDHYGLLDTLPSDANIYLSDGSYSMMQVGNMFYPQALRFNHLERCRQYSPGKPFLIGPFKITAYMVDHSAFGACALLVEVNNKQVFYSGDFRGHGRKHQVNKYLYANVKQPDVMLLEGTTLDDRHSQQFPTELSVEEEFIRLLSQEKRPTFVSASGSNIDRLVSLYNATKRTGKKLVIDLYQLYLLVELKKHAPGLPPHQDDHLRVIFPHSQSQAIKQQLGNDFFKYTNRHVNVDKLTDCDYVFRISTSQMTRFIDNFVSQGIKPRFIYSMWLGYQEKQSSFKLMEEKYQQKWHYAHTSGHAYYAHLQEFTNSINAKCIVPVHTLNPQKFADSFANVKVLSNNQKLEI